jgi:phosphoinositide-3-kinase regulatory subunit 4
MDIFSLGCTIAEIFLEGSPLFTLSQLLAYRKGEYDPQKTLQKIEDVDMRHIIESMIALSPDKRSSCQTYLQSARGKVFPEEFYSFIYPYMCSISDASFASQDQKHHVYMATNNNPLVTDCDARIEQIFTDFEKIAKMLKLEVESSEQPTQNLFPMVLSIPHFCIPCTAIIRKEALEGSISHF